MSSSGKRLVELVRVYQNDGNLDTRSDRHVGRDIKDVFPITSKKQVVEDAKEKGLLDVKTFVSGSSTKDHGHAETRSIPLDTRPLAEILMEQKAQKQAAFEADWKTMKTGKNRPLDEDEAAFLEQVVDNEINQQLDIRMKEEEQLKAFREAQNEGFSDGRKLGQPKHGKKRPMESIGKMVPKKPSKIIQARKVVKVNDSKEDEAALNLLGSYGSDSDS